MMAFTSIGCATGLEKMMDLPPDIARTIPNLPGIVVDGETGDWSPDYVPLKIHSDVCGNIPDTNDFQATFRMAWSEQGIFFLVEIIDDSIYEDPDHFWKGDGIELFLSRRRGSREILQVSARPGLDQSGSRAFFNAYDHLKSVSVNTSETSLGFSSKKTSQGYLLEGMVPFDLLRMEPRQNMEMALQLYLNDADREDDPNNFSLPWYPVRESYQNPYAFHSILLTDLQYPDVSPELRACIVDDKTVRIKVISNRTPVGQVFHIVSGSIKQPIEDRIMLEWNLPVDYTADGEKSMVGLMLGDQVADVLDLGMVKHVYEDSDPPKWYENEIRLFGILDRYDPPPDSAVLFTGSSTIRRWYSLAEDMYPQIVINRGFGGSVMQELNQNIERIVFPYNPSRIFVYEGDNDMVRGTEPLSFLEECKTFINQCQQRLPGTEIFFLSIKPSPARMRHWKQMERANQMLADLCRKKDHVMFIDISKSMFVRPGILRNDIYAEDGVHLNEKGYALLRKVIMENTINLSK